MFTGVYTALITPMKNGEVDTGQLRDFVEWQIAEGVAGLVPCGTTGETPTLSVQEQSRVIRTVVEQARKRVPIIAGAGANSTSKAIEASKMAKEAGADALLHVTPYYNKPTQDGLVEHYRAIATGLRLPVVLYNVPGRTGCDLKPETTAKLAETANIVAIKEATDSILRFQQLVDLAPKKFSVLSGDDSSALALCAVGGHGLISVIGNITPKWMVELVDAARKGEMDTARTLHYKLMTLMRMMFVESNPIPVKAAAALMGHTENELRSPMRPLSGETLERLTNEMTRLGLIS